jgi:hypothetical protein
MTQLEGGCSCGAVRYRLTDAPMVTHCCHCSDCQRQTGSAFVINALIETDRIEMLAAAPKMYPQPSPSGRGHDIYRCEACGTAMWSDYGKRPYLRFVRVGTLDEASAIAPDVHIFTQTKQPWVTLPADAPAYAVFYDNMSDVWSPEAMARRKAASEAAK